MNSAVTFQRAADGDCIAYAHTNHAFCVKAAGHDRSDMPEVAAHWFTHANKEQ